jgi:hypothetical protein
MNNLTELRGAARSLMLNAVLRPPPHVPRSERVRADYPVNDAGAIQIPGMSFARRYSSGRDVRFIAAADHGKQFFSRIFLET